MDILIYINILEEVSHNLDKYSTRFISSFAFVVCFSNIFKGNQYLRANTSASLEKWYVVSFQEVDRNVYATFMSGRNSQLASLE